VVTKWTFDQLQQAVIDKFGPQYAPKAKVLYLGDIERKPLTFDQSGFEELGISLSGDNELPDVILHDSDRNRIFLIEVVISHSPLSSKRLLKLKKMFGSCSTSRIYVSVFSNFAHLEDFVTEIAWETEVWLAEIPDHLIHFNGKRFLTPYTTSD
jgi:hypothetical protein